MIAYKMTKKQHIKHNNHTKNFQQNCKTSYKKLKVLPYSWTGGGIPKYFVNCNFKGVIYVIAPSTEIHEGE